jgi:5-formyltetrahydrofolate cyclo-ligase
VGADRAAERLAGLPAWQEAQVVKANPDRAQLPVRLLALRAGKLLYLAVPNLATLQPFYLLDPSTLTLPFEQAAASQGAAQAAQRIGVADATTPTIAKNLNFHDQESSAEDCRRPCRPPPSSR